MADEFSASAVGATVQECPQTPGQKPTHWIEIELIGEDEKPIPDVLYQVKMPSGDVARGYLDSKGCARVESIADPGNCEVTFPELDFHAWEPA